MAPTLDIWERLPQQLADVLRERARIADVDWLDTRDALTADTGKQRAGEIRNELIRGRER